MSETESVQSTTSTRSSTSSTTSSTPPTTTSRPETNKAAERSRAAQPQPEQRQPSSREQGQDRADLSREDDRDAGGLLAGMSDAFGKSEGAASRKSSEGPTSRKASSRPAGNETDGSDGRNDTSGPRKVGAEAQDGPTTRDVPRQGRVTTWPDGRMRTEKPDGTVESISPEGRATTRRPDGSVTVEEGGRTRTRHPDGKLEVQEIRDDGSRLERTSYEKNGAQIREETITQPNGESRTVSVVRKEGQVDRTVSRTRNIEGDIRDREETFTNGDAAQHVMEVQKDTSSAESMQVTNTKRTVTDTRTNPPITRTLDRSKTYSQEFQVDLEADSNFDFAEHPLVAGHLGTFNPPGRNLDLSGYDSDSSGTMRLAVTETSMRDGRSVDERRIGARVQYDHRIPDGGPIVPKTDTYTLEMRNGKRVQETAVEEVRGTSTDAVRKMLDKDEYLDRLGDGPIDYRETVSVPYNANGNPKPATQRVQAGEIDDPNRPGAKFIAADSTWGETNGGFEQAWTYHRADKAAGGGVQIQEQTSVAGTDVYTRTSGTLERDGSSHMTSRTYNGDDLLLTEIRHREQVNAQDVRDAHLPAYTGQFLKANEGAPLMKETVHILNDSGEEEPPSHASTTFTAKSGDSLRHIQYADAPENDSTFLVRPGSDQPFLGRAANGDEVQVDGRGSVYRVGDDGTRELLGSLEQSPEAYKSLSPVESSMRVMSHVGKLLQSDNLAGRTVPFVGGLTGALQLAEGETVADTFAGSSGVAEGLAGLSKVASAHLGDGGFSRALAGTGRVLGGASTVLGVAGGVAQIADGDELGGALTLAGTGGAAVGTFAPALTASAFVPGVGWTVAGLAAVASLGKFALEYDEAQKATHELQIP